MSESLELRTTDGASARLALQGAHLTHWQPAGCDDNALFLSESAVYAPGVAIRGGVPVIFPQFAGEGALPKHGFARSMAWTLVEHAHRADGRAVARLQLTDDQRTLAIWPHRFTAGLTVTIGGAALELQLDITNTDDRDFSFTSALHTYLHVDDIGSTRVLGLQHRHYRDSTAGGSLHRETSAALVIENECDRIYLQTPPSVQVQTSRRMITVGQQGFADTVVWNPGAARAAALHDLHPGGWRQMLCVEAAAVAQPVRLKPGQHWAGTQMITVATPS